MVPQLTILFCDPGLPEGLVRSKSNSLRVQLAPQDFPSEGVDDRLLCVKYSQVQNLPHFRWRIVRLTVRRVRMEKAHHVAGSSLLRIRISTNDGRFQSFQTPSRRIVLGRGVTCNLKVPLSWLPEEVLEIQNTPELLRVRSLQPEAAVTTMGRPLSEGWQLLPDRAKLRLQLGGYRMDIELQGARSSGPAMLIPEHSEAFSHTGISGATLMTADGDVLQEEAPPTQTPEQVFVPKERQRTWLHLAPWAAFFSLGLVILGLLGYSSFREFQKRARHEARFKQLCALIAKANDDLQNGGYEQAKTSLLDADKIARQDGWNDQVEQIRALFQQPEIQYGAAGLRPLNGKWVTPGVITSWHDAEQKYGENLRKLEKEIPDEIAAGDFMNAKLHCAEAMTLLNAYPDEGQPHPDIASIKAREQEVAARAAEAGTTHNSAPLPRGN